MERRRVLADTGLFIDHIRSRDKSATRLASLVRRMKVETSTVVAAELFYGARKPQACQDVLCVLHAVPIHPFTYQMAARQGLLLPGLLRINRLPDLPDLMIAASALELGLPVATLNRAHFECIPGLDLVE